MNKTVLVIVPKFVQDVCLDKMVKMLTEKSYKVKTVVYENPLAENELIPLVKNVDGYIAGSEIINKNVLEHADRLKVIAEFGVGVDNIDINVAKEKGIFVTNSAGENSYTVAEMAIALMLCLVRNIIPVNSSTKRGNWERKLTHELRNKKLGIIGFGNIGKWLARLALAFQMEIMAYDVIKDLSFAEQIRTKFVDFEYLIKNSDFISLHVPYSKENKNMIDKKEFSIMKNTAYLLNLSRGGIVNEEALYWALKEKKIAGAAIDVFVEEKPGHKPLYELPNIITTPHIAAVTYEATTAIGLRAAQNIIDVLEHQECKNIVNK